MKALQDIKIISMSAVLGNLARIITRHCQMSVAAAQDWDSVFLLDRYCVVELEFWKNNLRSVNTRIVSDSVTPFVSIYSDASDVACAGHIDGKVFCAHRYGVLSPPKVNFAKQHSSLSNNFQLHVSTSNCNKHNIQLQLITFIFNVFNIQLYHKTFNFACQQSTVEQTTLNFTA